MFDAGILRRNPSPTKLRTSICRSSKPSACSFISLSRPVTCNLLLDKHAPKITPKQTYACSVPSGKHSGVAISGYQHNMYENLENQSFCSNHVVVDLHPASSAYIQGSTHHSWLLENEMMVRDGFLWFLIILMLPETATDESERSKGDSFLLQIASKQKHTPLCAHLSCL